MCSFLPRGPHSGGHTFAKVLCIAIEMGGVLRYFARASGSGVDLTLLNHRWRTSPQRFASDSALHKFRHDTVHFPRAEGTLDARIATFLVSHESQREVALI